VLWLVVVCGWAGWMGSPGVRAQEVDASLGNRQAGVAERYQRLEELLLRLADVEAAENPERAALLRRAARQSRDKFVLEKLQSASSSLQTQQFQKAVENQELAEQELSALLNLLLSEDRSKRIRNEKERYARLIKDLKRNLNNQRSARARTENGADIEEVKDEQEAITQRSQELKDQLAEENRPASESQGSSQEAPAEPRPEAESGQDAQDKQGAQDKQDKPSEREGAEPQPEEDGDRPRDPSDQPPSDQPPSDQPPSPQGQPQEGQPQEGQPQEGQPQEGQPQDQESGQPQAQQAPPSAEQEVEQRLQQAIEKMRQAEQELEEAKREPATENQRQAEENLRAAIDRLEQILRQLREEELQRELAKLEARLKKMAAMQTKVLDDTVALAATPPQQRNRQTDLKAGNLAFEEKKITLEADRAMLLLREEGSSVAFPEVVSQIRADTTRVADLLGQSKIDAVTQGIQQDILAALEEMILALQKAQRDLEQKRQQEQEGRPAPQGPGEQPLVEALAELKLIRTMETRIKSTTDRYSDLIDSGDSAGEDVLPLLRDLSERQNRLYRITRDLVLKRNN
jgi:hypothetical protein